MMLFRVILLLIADSLPAILLLFHVQHILAAVTIYGSPTYVRIQAIRAQHQAMAPQHTHLRFAFSLLLPACSGYGGRE